MNVDFNIINQKGSPAIFSDTYANRPAASYPGRLFISTDTKEIYRDTGSAWEEIAGSGSGNIQGSGTANYVPKFTDTETIGNSQIRDDGTGVGIGVAPSAVYKLDISGSQRNTLTAAGGLSIVQSGVLEASFGVYNSSSGAAFLFEKFDDATATFTDSSIYALGGFYTKVSDGASTFYNSFFQTGNVAINSVTDAGYKFDCNGTVNFSGALTGTSATFSSLTSNYFTKAGVSGLLGNSGLYQDSNGYGIGTTTTIASIFSIVGQDNTLFRLQPISGNNTLRTGFYATGATEMEFYMYAVNGTTQTVKILASTGDATFSGAIAIGNTVTTAVAIASTNKVQIVVGGVTYYFLATTVA